MNCRDSPIRSAAPQSSAQRSSLRAWLKVMARVVVVTIDGVPSCAAHHQRRQPLAFAVPLVGGEPLDVRGGQRAGSWPPPGASTARKAPSSVAARRKASKVPPVRGQAGERSRSAR